MMKFSSSRVQQERRILSTVHILEMVEIGRLEVTPFYGSLPALTTVKKSQIIESLILGLPIDVIWSEQNRLGKTQLLSGFDLVISIVDFVREKFVLTQLNVLTHLNGLGFSFLGYAERRHFLEMDLSFNVIAFDSNPLLKCLFVENINKDKYRSTASQIARNIVFKIGSEEIFRLSDYVYEKIVINNSEYKRISKYQKLKLQTDVTYCLLIIYLTNNIIENQTISMESYSYSRSHISDYSSFENIEIQSIDNLNSAINKLTFMLEVDSERLNVEISFLKKYVNSMFDVRRLNIESIGRSFSNNDTEDSVSIIDYIFRQITHSNRSLNFKKIKTVYDLISEIQK
ncbi:hypothetical protein AC056_07305 [Acinetobacter genomosp. 33YU]|uniref:hypothetical protein n=1 Tax=Acinetobacter genomosp. 33YU TaxID=1675530 RepID=UPI00097F8CB5|nr:hypothetical protein [Acinetobacter genomosp. 33YU]ONN49961.1 hypothetical protein AC056_07305 [Acinetobacter genomosp. 33YU]